VVLSSKSIHKTKLGNSSERIGNSKDTPVLMSTSS